MSTQHVTLDLDEHEIVLDRDGERIAYYCDFTVEAKLSHTPARVSGPPEDCYPEESEIDIESIVLNELRDAAGTLLIKSAELSKQLADALNIDWLHERLWEEWQTEEELAADGPEPDEDD